MTEDKKYSIHRLEMMLTELKEQREYLKKTGGNQKIVSALFFLVGVVIALFGSIWIGAILMLISIGIGNSSKKNQASEREAQILEKRIEAIKETIIEMKETGTEFVGALPKFGVSKVYKKKDIVGTGFVRALPGCEDSEPNKEVTTKQNTISNNILVVVAFAIFVIIVILGIALPQL